jgi:O-antigen ligase
LSATRQTLSAITRYTLYALLIFTPLARGSVQGWAISLIHLATLIALTTLLMEKTLAWDWAWIQTPLDAPNLILIILVILSAVFSLDRHASLWAFVSLINLVIIYYLAIHTVKTRSQLKRVIYLIVILATFLSVFGLIKKSGVNPFPWWEYADIRLNQDLAAASSTYGNPNHYAGYLEMAWPLALGLFLTGLRGGKFILVICATLVILAGLIFSISRGGWISAACGLVFMMSFLLADRYFARKRLILLLMGGSLLVSLVALSSRSVVMEIRTTMDRAEDTSFQSRLLVWEKVCCMIQEHPFTGTGPGAFATLFTQYEPPGLPVRFYTAHNDYLHVVSETGLPLVPVIIWMAIVFYRRGFKKLNSPSRLVQGTCLGALSGITAMLVHSAFDFNLHIPANALLFAVLAAIVAGPPPKADRPDTDLGNTGA